MKRLIKVNSGHTSYNLDRVLNNVSRFRITQFGYTGGSFVEPVHVRIDNYGDNYDETNNLKYMLFFLCHVNGSVTYTPAMQSEGWVTCGSISSMDINVLVNGAHAGDITSRNCYLELEFV